MRDNFNSPHNIIITPSFQFRISNRIANLSLYCFFHVGKHVYLYLFYCKTYSEITIELR